MTQKYATMQYQPQIIYLTNQTFKTSVGVANNKEIAKFLSIIE